MSNSTACLAMAPIQLNTTKQPSSSRVAKAAKPRNTGGSTFLGEKIKASHSASTVISRAHKCVKEAIKCNYANWKVWDKFMVVSTDLGLFSDVTQSYHKILNFKQEPHLDIQVLTILVDAIVNDVEDGNKIPAKKDLDVALKLFGHITSKILTDPDV